MEWPIAGVIFAFLIALINIILWQQNVNGWTESAWMGGIVLWDMAVFIFGMCGPRSRQFLGVFILIEYVAIVVILWFWFRHMNKILKTYFQPEEYVFLWTITIFEFVLLLVNGVLLYQMNYIDREYDPNKSFYKTLQKRKQRTEKQKADEFNKMLEETFTVDIPDIIHEKAT